MAVRTMALAQNSSGPRTRIPVEGRMTFAVDRLAGIESSTDGETRHRERGRQMSCLEIRERLTEHALGLLPAAEAEEVDRHLQWCHGCRKEAAELAEGAGAFGLALPPVEPPPALESKIVNRLRTATGRTTQGGLRRVRGLVAATLVAALIALGATGWALAERSHALTLEQRLTAMRGRVQNFAELLKSSGGGKTFQADLLSPEGSPGSGFAAMFSAPRVDSLLFVDVVLPDDLKGPFAVQVVDTRRTWEAGTVKKTASGEWILAQRTGVDFEHALAVTVVDKQRRIVLMGPVHPYAVGPER
jgi:putative zinc finger protein